MFLFSLVIAILTSSVEGTMECFRIENGENYEVDNEIMQITGNGVMCNCFSCLNEFNQFNSIPEIELKFYNR